MSGPQAGGDRTQPIRAVIAEIAGALPVRLADLLCCAPGVAEAVGRARNRTGVSGDRDSAGGEGESLRLVRGERDDGSADAATDGCSHQLGRGRIEVGRRLVEHQQGRSGIDAGQRAGDGEPAQLPGTDLGHRRVGDVRQAEFIQRRFGIGRAVQREFVTRCRGERARRLRCPGHAAST